MLLEPAFASPRLAAFASSTRTQLDACAITANGRDISRAELTELVHTRAALLPDRLDGRCLVHIPFERTLEAVVSYLAVLEAGHVALVLSPAPNDEVLQAYSPDFRHRDDAFERVSYDGRPTHLLHDDLAVLTSTSGSTGSPKLVRLSHDNLRANAAGIAEALGLTPQDRGITALPLFYCYGLSVLHSHLMAGASIVLHDGSSIDDEFWDLVRRERVSNVPLVPHSAQWMLEHDVLDAAFPDLRMLTQAGGRLAPESVTRLAGSGSRQGIDLRVMYGQTEATARIAIAPAGAASTHPDTVGVAIRGTQVRLDHTVPEANSDGVGELVVTGDSVMLGYAEHADDLALGRMQHELRTGDLARIDDDGVIRIVGRRSGFVKLMGLRVDLGRVERLLGDAGYEAVVGGDDTGLRIAVAPRLRELRQAAKVRRAAAVASGVGPAVIDVAVTPIPLLDNGKVDRIGADALVRAATRDECSQTRRAVDGAGTGATVSMVAATIGDVLALDAVDPDKSFVEHGGDSLTHVPATARLTALVGDLPRDWHRRPVRELATATAQRRSTIETSVVVRAIAVVMICASHTQVVDLAGGAHILLALAGWSAARFGLALPDTGRRWRATLRSVIGIGVPTACAAFIGMVLTERYGWPNVFMLNWLFGSTSDSRVELWFIDALVLSLLVLTALVAIPAVARARDRDPWRLYLLIAALALVPRFVTQAVTDRPIDGLPYTVFWIVATGAALAHADDVVRKLVTIAVVVAGIATLFPDPRRSLMVVAGVTVIAFVPELRVPVRMIAPIVLLASASLYIYIFQFQLFQAVPDTGIGTVTAIIKTLTGLAGGCLIWWLADPAVRRLRNRLPAQPDRKDH
ncbi:acyl-CoA synthetase (AMP-forming)/AMP-acid ligase II [Yimella lutea]|uniref:Acyl-CoA synthetase (AMP-forming)/AMP-acid ligase II n=1 Tax=Yimella lutea TaxID=587872 RepID=A0A542EJH4_9MICO|nr:AMP-binding protein [Yimella lutea]TQJ15490.1 acyl-CoA synthetase (AMP-forming)/AMP-acid ligase II [Yimella lutea]